MLLDKNTGKPAMTKICRVLVVEDNGDIRELLGDVFAHEGYRFAMAENGEAMRRILANGDVDVVLIDLHLGSAENGVGLAREAAAAGCPVVMTTGDHRQEEQLAAEGHLFILKPYRLTDLLATVERALEAARARCYTKTRRFAT
jgi:DNA-binding NtrC family response regulator